MMLLLFGSKLPCALTALGRCIYRVLPASDVPDNGRDPFSMACHLMDL